MWIRVITLNCCCSSAPDSTSSLCYSAVSSPDPLVQVAFQVIQHKKERKHAEELQRIISSSKKKK